MQTRLEATKLRPTEDADVEFVRTDGKRKYKIYAVWDKSLNAWFQWGANPDILKENVVEVQKFYHSRKSMDFRSIADAISGRIRS